MSSKEHSFLFFNPPKQIISESVLLSSVESIRKKGLGSGIYQLNNTMKYRYHIDANTFFHIELALSSINYNLYNNILRLIELAQMVSTHQVFKDGIYTEFKMLMKKYPLASEIIQNQLLTEEYLRNLKKQARQFVAPRQAYQHKAIKYLLEYFELQHKVSLSDESLPSMVI